MSFYFFPTEFEQLKMEYLRKKMEQMNEIDELEKKFQYYAQFFEPQIELQMSNDNYVVALTQINHLDNPQPDFIQICVGILLEDRSNYADLKNKANELIKKELLENYPQIFN
jgi:predicted metal-dependent hydrolase